MQGSLCIAFVVGLFSAAHAHLCLLSPRQRGSMAMLNSKATADCYLVTGPCGDRPVGDVQAYLRAGMNFTVVMQKNADHFHNQAPGNFTVKFGVDSTMGAMQFDTLATMPDTHDPSLTLYTATVKVPDNARGQYVLQVTYATNNPAAPAMFYQCSDVFVV